MPQPKDKTGKPIPLEDFDNDTPAPDNKEPKPGSLEDYARKRIEEHKPQRD
jgi:hypothetical protein